MAMSKLLTGGLKQALSDLATEFRIWRSHRRAVKQARRILASVPDKLHLGCGPNHKAGWLNVDLGGAADLQLDLREPLPFPDRCFNLLYNEHFLEHVNYPVMAGKFLRECLRVLRPGGVIRIGVPDTEWPLFEYAGLRNEGYFNLAKQSWHPQWCKTDMEHINYHFRQDGEHRFAYDFVTLEHALQSAGFANVTRVEFNAALDSESRKTGTLYVTATRP